MGHYNNISNCIKMCESILNTGSKYNVSAFKSKYNQNDGIGKTYTSKDPLILHKSYISTNEPIRRREYRPAVLNPNYLSSTSFHPSRTVVVLNFQPEAETHVKSLVSRFGVIEICEIIKDEDDSTCLAVIQYMEVTSALNALLALPDIKVRGMNLVIQLLWNGSYDFTEFESSHHQAFKECSEKRIVCVGKLPRNVGREMIYMMCCRYGYVDDIRIQPQENEAFAYVAFRSPFSAAVATYCLRNSSRSSAALVMGYRSDGSPYLDGPVRVRTLDQYTMPLAAFDVHCIIERFKDYSKLKGLFVNLQRKLPLQYFFRPESSEYCARIPTTQIKGVSLFLEILLLENSLPKRGEISDADYNECNHKHLFRFSVDFGLNKPITPQNDRLSRMNPLIRWNAFFILDLQVCYTVGIEGSTELRLSPRIQGMNHVYSEVDSKLDTDNLTSLWFGLALRHSYYNLSTDDPAAHKNKIQYIVGTNLPFVRLMGSAEDLYAYQIPVHVYSDVQSDAKS